MYPSRSPVVRFPFATFAVLSCVFGWSLIIAREFGALDEAGQLPLGPIVAALLVAAGLGREGLREWWRHLRTVRTRPVWYLVAVAAPILILAAAVGGNALLGAPLPSAERLSGWTGLGSPALEMFIFVGIGEEAGWTAFAAPWLLQRMSFVRAWLVLATVRTLWHLPLMIDGNLDLFHGIVGNFAFQFLVLWLFRRSGVWLLAAIWHAVLNTFSGGFVYGMYDGPDRLQLGVLMVSGYVALAGVAFLADRRILDGREAAAPTAS